MTWYYTFLGELKIYCELFFLYLAFAYNFDIFRLFFGS